MQAVEDRTESQASFRGAPERWNRVYLLLAAVALLLVGMMTYLSAGADRFLARHAPLVDASMEIRLETTMGYLWLEELVHGVPDVTFEEVLHHFDQAAWYASAMVEGGTNSEGTFLPLDDADLRREIEEARAALAEFRRISIARFGDPAQAAPGSSMDRQQHALYRALSREVDEVETALQRAMGSELRAFHTTQAVLIAASVLAALLTSLVLYRFDRTRRAHLRDLRETAAQAQESEARFRSLFEESTDAVFLHDTAGRILRVNRRATEMLGRPAEELCALNLWDLHPEEARGDCRWGLGETAAVGRSRFDSTFLRADGSLLDVDVSASLVDPAQGLVQLLARDVTERKRAETALRAARDGLEVRVRERTAELTSANERLVAEADEREQAQQALAESEKKYSTLVESSLTGVFVYQDGVFPFANRKFCEILGYSREELAHLGPRSLVHPDDWPWVERIAARRLEAGAVPTEYETRAITKAGQTIWLQLNNTRIDYRGRPATLGNALDVTRRKHAQEALVRSQEELRRVSAKLLTAQEEERGRIARELHDGMGQSLSAMKFMVENLVSSLDPAACGPQAAELRGLVPRFQAAVEEVRRISMALRPSILDDLGLPATVSWLCREFRAAHPTIEVLSRVSLPEGGIGEELKTVIYRILQEAMNNAGRYSGARRVEVRLEEADGRAVLRVEDDGIGFDVGAGRRGRREGRGHGLSNMKERTELSGGRFALSSAPGQGTRVDASWPLAAR